MISQDIVSYPKILYDIPRYCMISSDSAWYPRYCMILHYILRYRYPKVIYSMIQSMIQRFNLWFNDSILGFNDSIYDSMIQS
jgi:hypothetical protein